MKKKLSGKETMQVAVMLFGMFFGAGNLIFPVHLGQLAGSNLIPAYLGFVVTGVGLPLLGVVAIGKSKSSGMFELTSKVSRGYGLFFTCLLYLTIGPCFAIPRCATTSFTVGVEALVGNSRTTLLVFTAIFFAVCLFFALRPNEILTWVGKVLTPIFLVFLGILIIIALINPMGSVSAIEPDASYKTGAFFNGFLEGYNTMDALASLAFGVIVIETIMRLGVNDSDDVAKCTIKSGVLSCAMMAVIYLGVCLIGTQSRGVFEISENGGIALAEISNHYFGSIGQLFLAVTVTFACLKTAVGLITSISTTFSEIFTDNKHYKRWAIGFTIFAFAVSNVGLTALISYSVPVLMFLYPLAITIILLGIFGNMFGHDRAVYISVTACTLFAAIFDFFNALGIESIANIGERILPLFSIGLGWIVPAVIGFVIGITIHTVNKNKIAG